MDGEGEKLDQYQFQLGILDQIQKLVQKLGDVSDIVGLPKSGSAYNLQGLSQTSSCKSDSNEKLNAQETGEPIRVHLSPTSKFNDKALPEVSSHENSTTTTSEAAHLLPPHNSELDCTQDKSKPGDQWDTPEREENSNEEVSISFRSASISTQSNQLIPKGGTADSEGERNLSVPRERQLPVYENLDNQETSTLAPGEDGGKENSREGEGDHGSPYQRSRSKLMTKGEYKAPVNRDLLEKSESMESAMRGGENH